MDDPWSNEVYSAFFKWHHSRFAFGKKAITFTIQLIVLAMVTMVVIYQMSQITVIVSRAYLHVQTFIARMSCHAMEPFYGRFQQLLWKSYLPVCSRISWFNVTQDVVHSTYAFACVMIQISLCLLLQLFVCILVFIYVLHVQRMITDLIR